MAEVERDESPSANAAGVFETPEQALQSAVDRHGPAMFYERAALGAFLAQRCPDSASDIALLLTGLEEQIPQALVGVHTDDDLTLLVQRLEHRLVERRSLNAYGAAWVVETWVRALRLTSVSPETVTAAKPEVAPAAIPEAAPTPIPATPRPATAAPRPVPNPPPRPPTPDVGAGGRRWYGFGGGALMALVAVVLVWREAAAPLPSAAAVPAATAPQAPAPSAALPEIAGVTSDEPLTGDGSQRNLFVVLKKSRDDIKTVESRFVDGDAVLRPQAAVVEVGTLPAGARLPAGTIGLRSTHTVEATFEFVVTTTDGRRSAPFVKELSIAAVPAVPPTITDVVIPANVVAGAPFTAAIGVRPGDAQLAAIERTIVDPTHKARTDVRIVDVSTLRRAEDGKLDLPMRAAHAPSTMTMDLVLIDADGMRSEPKRVDVEVGSTNASANVVASTGSCTPATCGSVVAVRELDDATFETRLADAFGSNAGRNRGRAGRKQYEVQVRTDDGVTRTLRQATPSQKGDRVRVSGGKLSSLDDSSPAGR